MKRAFLKQVAKRWARGFGSWRYWFDKEKGVKAESAVLRGAVSFLALSGLFIVVAINLAVTVGVWLP